MTGDVFEYHQEGSDFAKKNGYVVGGVWLPRVTSILEIVAKPGLLRYYAQQKNFLSAQETLTKAAIRGKKIHDVCEAILLGEKPEIPQDIKPTIERFIEWKNKHKVEVLDVETRVYDKDNHYFAGTMDILAKIGNDVGIIDIKTGSGIYNGFSLQTAAYLQAYNQDKKPALQATKRWILRLDQFQKCKICNAKLRIREGEEKITGGKHHCNHEFDDYFADLEFKELKNLDQDFKAFLNAKELWEWENKGSLKRINNYPKNFSV